MRCAVAGLCGVLKSVVVFGELVGISILDNFASFSFFAFSFLLSFMLGCIVVSVLTLSSFLLLLSRLLPVLH